jgi:hypothetical protein
MVHRGLTETWPTFLVAHFMHNDRLVLLTENRRRDQDGLWRILHEEIKPALEAEPMCRLGLLVIFKRGKSSHPAYADSVVDMLQSSCVAAGFNTCKLPAAA